MILGLSLSTFTILHVVLSLIGIVAGFVVVWGMFSANHLPGWTALFLVTTILTSVTGFMFKSASIMPSHIFGVISLVALATAVLALYVFRLAGPWRWIYVAGAIFALYLNAFVAVVQAFTKIPAVHALAPTQAEAPFAIAQGVVLLLFIAFGVLAVMKFRPMAALQG